MAHLLYLLGLRLQNGTLLAAQHSDPGCMMILNLQMFG